MKKLVLLPGLIIGTLAIAGSLWTMSAKAETAATPTMSQKIAEKLNISSDQVEKAMDEIRTERRAETQKAQDTKLDQAVTDGIITSTQKDALIAKRNEMRTRMEKQHAEMQTWMAEQGIDESKLQPYMGKGMGRSGHSGGMRMGQNFAK